MDISSNINQQQKLKQLAGLSQRQHNSLELLYKPVMDLQAKIDEELSLNPVLEIREEEEGSLCSPEDEMTAGDAEFSGVELFADRTHSLPDAPEDPSEKMFDSNREDYEDHLDRVLDTPEESYISSDLSGSEKDRAYLFDSLVQDTSMEQSLLDQLQMTDADEKVRLCAEYIIGSLHANGYFMPPVPGEENRGGGTLADAAQSAGGTLEDAQKALSLVQSFDPPGIAARDLKECLLLQIRRKKNSSPLLIQLVTDHLEDLYKNRLPLIARKMQITLEDLQDLIDELADYSTQIQFENNALPYVVPEITIVREGDSYRILENDPPYGKLALSKSYLKMLEDPTLPPDARQWIQGKVRDGKDLIKQLSERKRTIYRLAELILENQYEFMSEGPKALKPMTMIQAGDKLGLDNSTISKTAAGKYMLTPVGLFEFRYFFSGGYQSADGVERSEKAIKSMLEDFIAKEDKRKPLSDSKLCDLLHEKGFDVARRTVAKYREEMQIGSSTMRKAF